MCLYRHIYDGCKWQQGFAVRNEAVATASIGSSFMMLRRQSSSSSTSVSSAALAASQQSQSTGPGTNASSGSAVSASHTSAWTTTLLQAIRDMLLLIPAELPCNVKVFLAMQLLETLSCKWADHNIKRCFDLLHYLTKTLLFFFFFLFILSLF